MIAWREKHITHRQFVYILDYLKLPLESKNNLHTRLHENNKAIRSTLDSNRSDACSTVEKIIFDALIPRQSGPKSND